MLKLTQLALLSLLGLVICGCTTIEVENNYDTKINFSTLKTYAWLNDTDNPSENIRVNNKVVIDIVRAAVEEDLSSKGFAKTGRGQADFLIAWFGAIEQKIKTKSINHFYSTYGYGTLYHNPTSQEKSQVATETEYEEGSLIFDFLNPKDQTLIWRGTGSDKMVEGQPEEIKKQNLTKAIQQILSSFPPK